MECNGAVVPSALVAPGFVEGIAEVTVSGLAPGTPYSLRCRCEVKDSDVDPDALWSPRIKFETLDAAGLEVCRACAWRRFAAAAAADIVPQLLLMTVGVGRWAHAFTCSCSRDGLW